MDDFDNLTFTNVSDYPTNISANDSMVEKNLCMKGLLIPLSIEKDWSWTLRAVFHFVGLMYAFLGIAILADVFMCSIERITSATRKIRLEVQNDSEQDASGVKATVKVKEVLIWNPTIANLTLMALGSSAPEILLSCIEVVGSNFVAGDLGPGTIVGSAAFNLMAITAVCMVALPDGETKRITHISVFCVTSAWSCFAYVWIIIILLVTSADEVELWEGTLTLVFFFGLLITSYVADKKMFERRFKRQKPAVVKEIEPAAAQAAETSTRKEASSTSSRWSYRIWEKPLNERPEWHKLERQAKIDFPYLSAEDLAKLVAFRIYAKKPKDYLEHRIEAIRGFSKSIQQIGYFDPASQHEPVIKGRKKYLKIDFAAKAYGFENGNEKNVRLKIVRRGRAHKKIQFLYETVEAVAQAYTHFVPKKETLIFMPNETEKFIFIDLVSGVEWKAKDYFSVKLEIDPSVTDERVQVGKCSPTEVRFIGKDAEVLAKVSVVEFVKNNVNVKESKGCVRLPVIRKGSCKPKVSVVWHTEDITAKQGFDYEGSTGTVTFEEGEVEKFFEIPIAEDIDTEKDEMFLTKLVSNTRQVQIGATDRLIVTILNDDSTNRFLTKLDQLVPEILRKLEPGSQSWNQQFEQYLNVNGGDVVNATLVDYFGHLLSFPWKAIVVFIPPSYYLGGWLTFVVSLCIIGVVTALVGDMANTFGCLVGLDPTITAITFVALGTSLPDTFASRIATIQDNDADNAIGNVTGSNSVNVFLGLGLPWFMASLYWTIKGEPFRVPSAGLGFSVTIYCLCSIVTIGFLFLRRYSSIFGKAEIGGTCFSRWFSAVFLIAIWFFYIVISVLVVYKYINVGF